MRKGAAFMVTAVCALLAGCGSDDGGETGRVETKTVVKTVEGPTKAEKQAAAEAPAEEAKPPARVPQPRHGAPSHSYEFFQTPSRNIGCAIISGFARCDIKTRYWSPPPTPSWCELDWGHAFYVDAAGSGLMCVGDSAHDPGSPVVDYGEYSEVGEFVCVVATAGVTCSHPGSGHGFFVSRERYTTY